MAKPKSNAHGAARFYPRLERRGQPLATHWRFALRLAINLSIGLGLILVSLVIGMICYHQFEGLRWLDSFSHAAMILGGMGPYTEPKTSNGKVFEGLYALYSGLLLVGVTGLVLSPIFHRVMHEFNLPDEQDPEEGEKDADEKNAPKKQPRKGSRAQSTKR